MKKEAVVFEIPMLPPSVNHALKGARRYPTKEYKEWQSAVSKLPVQKIVDSKWYGVERVFYFPLFYKNGNVRRKDVANYIKYADDEFCKRLETYDGGAVDDMQIIEGAETKVDSEEVKTVYTIYAIV